MVHILKERSCELKDAVRQSPRESQRQAAAPTQMFDLTPDAKGSWLFGAALSAVALAVYVLTLGGFLSKWLPIGNLTLNPQEAAFIWTIITSNILLIFVIGYFLFNLVRAEFKAIHWYHEYREAVGSIDSVSKAKQVHCTFAQNAHALYNTYIEAQTGELTTPHLGLWVNRVKGVFDQYSSTGQSAVCVKLFEPGAERKIRTAIRDDLSKLIRSRADRSPDLKLYDPNLNTAFVEILSPAHEDWFFCNDLAALGEHYQNANPRWPKYYNATVVAPIKPITGDVNKTTFGFLCVDSKKGIFDQDVAIFTLVFFANLLFDHLQATLAANPIPQDRRVSP